MSAATNCACPCPTPEIVTVPGTPGTNGVGTNGTNGVNAFTTTTSSVLLPAAAGPVVLATSVGVASWAGVGQIIFISDIPANGTKKGHFQVLTIPSSTSLTLQWLNYPGDSVGTSTIASGATVSPAGIKAVASGLPTALTNNTTGTPGATLAAGVGISTLIHPLTSLATGLGALAIDLLTNYVPGYAFKLLKFDFVTTVAGTGAAASQVFNLEIGNPGTNVTNTLTVTLASTATIGAVTAGSPSPIVALNTGSDTDVLSIEMAAGGTVFTAGAGYFVIKIQNMDTADAIKSISTDINTLITALT